MNLEGYTPGEWLVFERVLIVRDLYTGGGRTFLDGGEAREFRANIYKQYGAQRGARRTARRQKLRRAMRDGESSSSGGGPHSCWWSLKSAEWAAAGIPRCTAGAALDVLHCACLHPADDSWNVKHLPGDCLMGFCATHMPASAGAKGRASCCATSCKGSRHG